MIVGVTNEPESMVTKDVAKKKMKYPVAIVEGEDFDRQYGIRGFPTSFLVGPDGEILWTGHPGSFEPEMLEEHLQKLWLPPTLPDKHAALNELLAERNLAKAWKALEKARAASPDDADLTAVAEKISARVTARLEEGRTAEQAGDFAAARRAYVEVTEVFGGVPGAEAAKTALADLAKNKLAKAELDAADKLDEALAQWRGGDLEKGLRGIRAVLKKHEGTAAGKVAAEFIDRHPEGD